MLTLLYDSKIFPCRHSSAIRPSVLSEFGSGNGNFLLDEVNCIGNETSLEECQHEPWRKHDCRTYEAAGVVCKVAKGEKMHCVNMNTYFYLLA